MLTSSPVCAIWSWFGVVSGRLIFTWKHIHKFNNSESMAQFHRQKLHILIQSKTIFFLHTRDKSKVHARDVKRNKIKNGLQTDLQFPFAENERLVGCTQSPSHRQPFHNIHVSNTNNINPSIQNQSDQAKRHNASSRAKTTILTYIY